MANTSTYAEQVQAPPMQITKRGVRSLTKGMTMEPAIYTQQWRERARFASEASPTVAHNGNNGSQQYDRTFT